MRTESNEITPELIAEHGLSDDEYARILAILGRAPNLLELGIFSVMWSEHCSYKSSRHWLKRLPTEAPWVICGPGENAGVVDIGDGMAAVFKIESHNHPSFIEPYQGAATGVGGILRDVFTMGARPVALLDSLRFGAPEHPRTRYLVDGVVAGIGGYGNCVGVPTVGGETTFHGVYNGNILVNAMCVGLVAKDQIFYARAAGPGNPVVYVGAKTGRDGIHGATMASAEFSEAAEARQAHRPGRRPVHREAAARGLPGADADRRDRRDPGHGCCRPDLVVVRDGGARRRRHRDGPRPRADPRDRHDPLRDHALGEPGAHAAGAAPGRRGYRTRRVRQVGPRLRHRRPGHRQRCGGAALAGDEVAHVPIAPIGREAPLYERALRAPAGAGADRRARRRERRSDAGRRCCACSAAPTSPRGAGSSSSTTTW